MDNSDKRVAKIANSSETGENKMKNSAFTET
jgi:hypothetical protein